VTQVVRNPKKLNSALNDIKDFVDSPHFKTKVGQKFTLQEFKKALEYSAAGCKNGNAVFTF